jgi:hypothetical protein
VLKGALLPHSLITGLGLLGLLAYFPLPVTASTPSPTKLLESDQSYETTAEGLWPEALDDNHVPLNFESLSYFQETDVTVHLPSTVVGITSGERVKPDFTQDQSYTLQFAPNADLLFPPSASTEIDPHRFTGQPQLSPHDLKWRPIPSLAPEPSPILAQQQQEPPSQTPSAGDPELGVIRVRNTSEDPELGILRIRERPIIPEVSAPDPPDIGFFTTRLTVSSSDNVLLAVNDVGGLTGDEFIRPSMSLAVYPPIGPQTFLIGNIDVGLQRYTTQSNINYDDLRFRLGVRQGLFPRTYGQLMFTYQQLFRPGSPRFRFFENTAFSFTLGRRDPLTDQLTLSSYYQIQLNDAESRATADGPTDLTQFDRITQSMGGYLNYTISPKWRTGVSYQITFSDYTGQERYDTYHQLLGQLVYRITPSVNMSLYGGWSFGRSSEPRIRFDDTFLGITVDATVTLF